LLSSAFEKVKKAASTDLLCYVNSDIIFLSDFVPSVKRINTDRFLLLGNRWNIDVNEPIDFADNSWERRLRERVKSNGSLQPPLGADYFVLKKNEALSDIPPFAVGRPFWDLWFIYNARKNKYKVIDASQAITVLHQNHDYAHLRRDYCRNQSEDFNWGRADGPEVDKQKQIMDGEEKWCKLMDATHVLTQNEFRRAVDYDHLRRRFDTLPVFYPQLEPVIEFINRNLVANIRKYRKKKLHGLV
jgi:hypothetical protein